MTHPSWVVCCFAASNCSKTALSNIVLVSASSSNNRHSLFGWDCSFCSFSVRLPSPLWSFHNLESSKLEGCRLALRRCVEARCQNVEYLSTLSVLCLVIALSDCIIVSSYSDGELLLINSYNYVLFLSTFIYGLTSEFQVCMWGGGGGRGERKE